jgi:uncharacterized membrane protein YbhN (UPF0104 family)
MVGYGPRAAGREGRARTAARTETGLVRLSMQRAFSPRLVVPLVFGLGLIILLLGYADVAHVLRVASTFRPSYLLLILMVTGGYEALRVVQWFLLLRVVNPCEPWQTALMSYMGGEVTKALPGGQYFQAYLLRQARGVPIACSTAATTIILRLEVAVSAAIVLLLGLGPWTWVRPAALALLGASGVLVLLVKWRPGRVRVRAAAHSHPRLRPAWLWWTDFVRWADLLLRPRAIGVAAALCAGYIACAALELWAIVAALSIPGIGLHEALVVYAFALGLELTIPIPTDLGLMEISGLAALMAYGMPRADALTVMLIQRILSTILVSGIAGVSLVLLRGHLAAILRTRGRGA